MQYFSINSSFLLPNLQLNFEPIDWASTKGSGKSATMALLVHQLAEADEIPCGSIGYDSGSFGNSSDNYSDPLFFGGWGNIIRTWDLKNSRTDVDMWMSQTLRLHKCLLKCLSLMAYCETLFVAERLDFKEVKLLQTLHSPLLDLMWFTCMPLHHTQYPQRKLSTIILWSCLSSQGWQIITAYPVCWENWNVLLGFHPLDNPFPRMVAWCFRTR